MGYFFGDAQYMQFSPDVHGKELFVSFKMMPYLWKSNKGFYRTLLVEISFLFSCFFLHLFHYHYPNDRFRQLFCFGCDGSEIHELPTVNVKGFFNTHMWSSQAYRHSKKHFRNYGMHALYGSCHPSLNMIILEKLNKISCHTKLLITKISLFSNVSNLFAVWDFDPRRLSLKDI